MGCMTDEIPRRPAAGLRAMVVEDEIELAALVGSYLERGGFEVLRRTRGQDGSGSHSVQMRAHARAPRAGAGGEACWDCWVGQRRSGSSV
jgi:hypothetical protein